MPGQPRDLQAWLEELRRRAEGQGRQERPATARAPQARAEEPQPQEQAEPAMPTSPGSLLMSLLQEALGPAPEERQARSQADRRFEEVRRRKDAAKQRAAEVRAKRAAESRRQKQEQEAARRLQVQEQASRKKARPRSGARSSLGLSGDLIHDLRSNPQALREAILLVEILGPPLADRDPFERML